jgi:hypothetical protein
MVISINILNCFRVFGVALLIVASTLFMVCINAFQSMRHPRFSSSLRAEMTFGILILSTAPVNLVKVSSKFSNWLSKLALQNN